MATPTNESAEESDQDTVEKIEEVTASNSNDSAKYIPNDSAKNSSDDNSNNRHKKGPRVSFKGHPENSSKDVVDGVLITSNNDQERGKDKYIPMSLPRTHAIFQLKPTAISTAMGLELLVQKTTHADELAAHPEAHLNRTGAYLHLPVSADEDEFGFLEVFLDDMSVGPVNVVRRDKVPITPKQVEALAIFARIHLAEEHAALTSAVFGPEEAEERAEARREWVRTRLTREEFERFFAGLKKSRMEEDPSWADVISPYNWS